MSETIFEMLAAEGTDIFPYIQGKRTKLYVNPGPFFEVRGVLRRTGQYEISVYDGENERAAVEAFEKNESK